MASSPVVRRIVACPPQNFRPFGGDLRRFFDHRLHDIDHATSLAVAGPLTSGRTAPRQRRTGQVAHGVPVIAGLELRAERHEQVVDDLGGRQWLRLGAKSQEVTVEPTAGSSPHRRSLHRRRSERKGLSGRIGLRGSRHCGTEEPGNEHGLVNQRTGVAHPELQRRHVVGRADVEVGHFGVADNPGGDERAHHLFVLFD